MLLEPKKLDIKDYWKIWLREAFMISSKTLFILVPTFLVVAWLYSKYSNMLGFNYEDKEFLTHIFNTFVITFQAWIMIASFYFADNNKQALDNIFSFSKFKRFITVTLGINAILLVLASITEFTTIANSSDDMEKPTFLGDIDFGLSILITSESILGIFHIIHFLIIGVYLFSNLGIMETISFVAKGLGKNLLNLVIIASVNIALSMLFFTLIIDFSIAGEEISISVDASKALIFIFFAIINMSFLYVYMKHVYFGIEPKKVEAKEKAPSNIQAITA